MKAETLKGVEAFLHRHFKGRDVEPPAPPAAPAAPDKPPKDKKTDFKPKPPKATPVPAPTAAEIAAAAAEGVAKAMREEKPKATETPPPAEKTPLQGPQDRTLAVLKRLEKSNPEKYKGISEKYETGIRALNDYAAKWESEHPGETFDDEAPEHEEFHEKHHVDWDDEDFDREKIRMEAEPIAEERLKPLEQELQQLRQKESLRENTERIVQNCNAAARDFWTDNGEGFADIVDEKGNTNVEKLKALIKSDPVGTEMRIQAAKYAEVQAAEVYKLYHRLTDNLCNETPKNTEESAIRDATIQMHREINQLVWNSEQEMLKQPIETRTNQQGQTFAPASQYWRMTVAERQRHWTYSADDIRRIATHNAARKVNESITAFEAARTRANRAQGLIPEEPPPQPQAGGDEGSPPSARTRLDELRTDKPDSPSTIGGPKMATGRQLGDESQNSSLDTFKQRFLGAK